MTTKIDMRGFNVKDLLSLFWEGTRFLGVGLCATVLDMAVLFGLSVWGIFGDSANFALAFYISVLCRFAADKKITFRVKEDSRDLVRTLAQLLRYVLSCSVTLVVGMAAFNLFLWIGCSVMLSKVMSVPPVTITGYFLFRIAVFRLGINLTVKQ